jgi:hypothetical protein
MAKPEYSGPWRRVRLRVLERDGHLCQIKGPKCRGVANQVDHIVPVSKGGSWLDTQNLRASCSPCNLARVDHTGDENWRTSSTRITLVIGPPGADTSGYVAGRIGPNDIVIDYDALAGALGGTGRAGHKATSAARNAVLTTLRRGESEARRAWIVSAAPHAESVLPHHEVIVIDPGMDEAIAIAQKADDANASLGNDDALAIAHKAGGDNVARVHTWYTTRTMQPGASVPSRAW